LSRATILRQIRFMQRRVVETTRVLHSAENPTPRQKAARTRACHCLAIARRQLAALDAGRPARDWIEVLLPFDPCDPKHFLTLPPLEK
jgi:hypothetical protein